ncbi:hypothetical protein [Leptospira bandrabouensis]|uniref:hypothetical protein n=1 Tax=Leptospira bandrabouensis TaxID=2484903 RepID=UPI001EE9A7DA|nr:hypothetical protein [Leptospira bandrabouensis]MCG6146594.1 hypothetical protein [Leptospira bandrabouensis]MCG6161969.1 hypothetical protein [Leptospira bandrabouensis]MCG6166175.1 hypothetical protein [Leptospira bandrabouensis]
MDKKETEENIMNAFEVVEKTYHNSLKLLNEIEDKLTTSEFISITPNKYLRYRSDVDFSGIIIKSLIKLFQKQNDPVHIKNENLRNGPIFGIEINFGNYAVPKLIISSYIFSNIEDSFSYLPSLAEHWLYFNSIHNKDTFEFLNELGSNRIISIPRTPKISKTYWNLKKAIFTELDLLNISSSEDLKTLSEKLNNLIIENDV